MLAFSWRKSAKLFGTQFRPTHFEWAFICEGSGYFEISDRFSGTIYECTTTLDVQIADTEGMFLDEFAARLDFVPHEDTKHFVRGGGVR